MQRYFDPGHERVPSRWELIRDVVVFQGKLFLDGLRDMAMVPISLVGAALDLLGVGDRAGLHFYDAVRAGRRTEEWINLFGAADRTLLAPPPRSGAGLDRVVGRLEMMVKEEYESGGLTRSAKDSVDRALDRLRESRGGGGPGPDPGT